MLANYVGEDVFLKGVSIYLKEHLYGNSITNDLWSGIAKASGVDVPKMMNNWVTKVRTGLNSRGMYTNLTLRWAIQSLRSLKSKEESTFARTDSLSPVPPRRRIIKPFGTFLDTDDHPTLIQPVLQDGPPLSSLRRKGRKGRNRQLPHPRHQGEIYPARHNQTL